MKSIKAKSVGKKDKNKLEVDSRKGDFDSEEEISSLGLEEDRLRGLNSEIEDLQPTFTEKYNEYKVDQGLQDRLEDSELPSNLENKEVFEEVE